MAQVRSRRKTRKCRGPRVPARLPRAEGHSRQQFLVQHPPVLHSCAYFPGEASGMNLTGPGW